jgi:hypothetical protein
MTSKQEQVDGMRWSLRQAVRDSGYTPDVWGVDGYYPAEYHHSYDTIFAPVLDAIGHRNLSSVVDQRKSRGLATHVLDIMGGAYLLPEADSLTGVRLKEVDGAVQRHREDNVRLYSDKEEYRALAAAQREFVAQTAAKRSVIAGDVFDADTWEKIATRGQDLGNSGMFDMVFFRPWGGIPKFFTSQVEKSPEQNKLFEKLLLELFQRSVKVLSPTGIMLFQTPENLVRRVDVFARAIRSRTTWDCKIAPQPSLGDDFRVGYIGPKALH